MNIETTTQTVEVVNNIKKEIEFWLKCLKNPNLDDESKMMMNKCIQDLTRVYVNPKIILKSEFQID